jgi:fatty-acyl-CoA synthase
MSAPSLTGFLEERRSANTALVDRGRRVSYADLDEESRRLARGLAELGVGAGDRVGLWLPNGVAWVALWFACARLGAIAIAINTRFRSVDVGDIVARSGCKLLALWPGFKGIDFAGILNDVDPVALARLGTLIVYDEGEHPPAASLPGKREVAYWKLLTWPPLEGMSGDGESGCIVFTTSGTTRAPKLVLHKQSVIVRHGCDVARAYGYEELQTVALIAVPLCGVFGLCQLMAALAACRPAVLMPLFDPAEAVRLIEEHRVTHMCGGDEMLHRMLQATERTPALPSLALYGLARFDPALADIAPCAEGRGVRVRGLYGMSEVQALFSLQPDDAPPLRRSLAGGIPVSSAARVHVRDPKSGKVLPHGAHGELEIMGPSLMAGYLDDPEATRAALTEDGFFRTGDLGYTDQDGGFVFLSRMGDVLRLGGFLVSPDEIEGHLLDHAAINGAQVVGVSAPRGPRAVAFVTIKPGARFDEEELRAHCREGLANYKVPERIVALEEFPTTPSPNGPKIQRARLREMAQGLYRPAAG